MNLLLFLIIFYNFNVANMSTKKLSLISLTILSLSVLVSCTSILKKDYFKAIWCH